MKNAIFLRLWRRSKHTLTLYYIFSVGQDPDPQDLRPCMRKALCGSLVLDVVEPQILKQSNDENNLIEPALVTFVGGVSVSC